MFSFFNVVRRWLGLGSRQAQNHKHWRVTFSKDYDCTYTVINRGDYRR